MYKINLHCHTIFSDGFNCPYVMALKARELGFSTLVITDHYYGKNVDGFMSKNNMRLLKKACKEAEKILPIIIGLEILYARQEILVFGSAAVNHILENCDKVTDSDILHMKKTMDYAFILCHPGKNYEETAKIVDGFEQYNSGFDYFRNKEPIDLHHLPGWCNSDAHMAEHLVDGDNLLDVEITTEENLISYIKSGKQPIFSVGLKSSLQV